MDFSMQGKLYFYSIARLISHLPPLNKEQIIGKFLSTKIFNYADVSVSLFRYVVKLPVKLCKKFSCI